MIVCINGFRNLMILILICISLNVSGQYSNRYKDGYIIDKYGAKYSGLVKMTEGANDDPDYLLFKESEKADKIKLEKATLRSFVIEKDSFIVVNNYKVPKKKTVLDGFAKILLKTPNEALCELIQHQRVAGPSSNAYDDNRDYFFIIRDKNYIVLTNYNFKHEMTAIVEENGELKKKINSGEFTYKDLNKVVDLYLQNKQ